MLCKKGVLKNFVKLTGKANIGVSFKNVADLQPASLLKRDSGTDVSCEFCQNSKDTFFIEHFSLG